MKIVEVDAQDKTVADHSPGKPEATDAPCPPQVGESEDSPRIDRLIRRAQLLADKSASLMGTLRGIAGTESFGLPAAVDAVEASVNGLMGTLLAMNSEGFECRSTVKSRAIARMRPGTPVRLVDERALADMAYVYGEDAAGKLTVKRWTGDRLWLQVGDAISGPHRWSDVEEIEDK